MIFIESSRDACLSFDECYEICFRQNCTFSFALFVHFHLTFTSESPNLKKLEETLYSNKKGWKPRKKFSKGSGDFKKYKVGKHETGEISWIYFGYDGLYITDEFDSFIIDWQDKNTEKIIEQLKKDLM